MKILYSLLALSLTLTTYAQNAVVFRVDMSEYAEPFTQVTLNGTFNGWCGECAPMNNTTGNIWELEVDLPDGQQEYKFVIGNWEDDEMFNPGAPCTLTSGNFTNRVVDISGDTTLPLVCWESCGECGTVTSADVTFRVDMSDYSGDLSSGVNLNGSFNGWCGECTPMTDDDGDDIYETTVNIGVGQIEYKFVVGNWEVDEMLTQGTSCTMTTDQFTNRVLDVSEEVVLEAVCWESCVACGASSVDEYSNDLFSVFPNPSEGLLRINTTAQLYPTVIVYDLSGATVANPTIDIDNGFVDLSHLQAGIYFVEMNSDKARGMRSVVIK